MREDDGRKLDHATLLDAAVFIDYCRDPARRAVPGPHSSPLKEIRRSHGLTVAVELQVDVSRRGGDPASVAPKATTRVHRNRCNPSDPGVAVDRWST